MHALNFFVSFLFLATNTALYFLLATKATHDRLTHIKKERVVAKLKNKLSHFVLWLATANMKYALIIYDDFSPVFTLRVGNGVYSKMLGTSVEKKVNYFSNKFG